MCLDNTNLIFMYRFHFSGYFFYSDEKFSFSKIFFSRSGFSLFDYIQIDSRKGRQRPPFNLTIQKGSKNVALTRNFSEFVINGPVPLILYNWMFDMPIPDESFYSTLATLNFHDNGTFTQDVNKNTTYGMVGIKTNVS